MRQVAVAVIGASGYMGEELIRLLLRHPRVKLTCVTSRQNDGKTLAEVYPKFSVHPATRLLKFTDPTPATVIKSFKKQKSSVVFLALPHGVASKWAAPLHKAGIRVIDLSADFRLKDAKVYKEFYHHDHPAPALMSKSVYGLPEVYRPAIRKARFIASPGCYPTSILLPLIPLLRAGIIKSHGIIANSMSGVSGAGRKSGDDAQNYLYCERNEAAHPYGVPKHRHLSEIEQELSKTVGSRVLIEFTPHLIPLNRGILTTLYVRPAEKSHSISHTVEQCYQRFYGEEPFIRLLKGGAFPDIKNVAGTNTLEIAHRYDARTGRILIFSAEDNLTKGGSGQAVQSMNIMCGFPETDGLL